MPKLLKTSLNKEQLSLNSVKILGIKITSTPKSKLLELVQKNLVKKIPFDIVTPNPEIVLQAQSDPKLAHSLNSAEISLPDGVGLKFAAKNLKVIKGREFMTDIFEIANKNKLKIYLFGSVKEVNKKALEKIQTVYPDLTAKGASGPLLDENANPVSKVDRKLEIDIVKEINYFRPDMLFIALGAPKQEKWISKWRKDLKVTGTMVIGGSLDYFIERSKPVPVWMENLGLEWLWRLIITPNRWGRILNATVVFPLTIMKRRA